MINKPYEAIVVGSGATGGVAALTLAEAGVRVLIIEAGPDHDLKKTLGSEPLNTLRRLQGVTCKVKRIQSQHPGFWKANPLLYANEKENPYTHPSNKPFLWTQGIQVGGRSLTWGGITLRLSNHDFKAATYDNYGPEWPISYSELAPHYSAIEKRLKIYGNCDYLEKLPDGDYIGKLPLTPSENKFASIVEKSLGYKIINSRGFESFDGNQNNEWPRSSSRGSTLKFALDTGNVEILSNHIVEAIEIDKINSKAKGLIILNKTTRKRERLSSSLIILCASTIQTNRILLSSEEMNGKNCSINRSGKLGHNLMDHISTSRFFAYPKQKLSEVHQNIQNEFSLSGAGSFFIPYGQKFKPTGAKDFIRGYGIWGAINRFDPPDILKKFPDTNIGFLIGHGEVLARSNNKISLSNKTNKWGVKVPHIEFEWGENEKKMVKNMNLNIKEIIEIAGGIMLPLNELIHTPFITPLIKGSIALQEEAPPPGYYIHEVGGAPMGSNQENSVVDNFNRLWGCSNVLVVDGACWPTSSWQSPTLTMMAITRRACLNAVKASSS